MAVFDYKFLLDELDRLSKERAEKYDKMRERVIERAKTANNGVEPVFDVLGCPHAPHDGYVFTKAAWVGDLGDVWDEVYAGGQYLPWSAESGGVPSGHLKLSKVLFPESIYQEMVKAGLPGWVRSDWIGKKWKDNKNFYGNREVRYLWLHDEDWLVNKIEKIVSDNFDQAVPAIEEPPKPLKGVAPEGRVSVSGTVLCTKWQESIYGSTLKMLVELGNYSTVWGSVPSKLLDLVNDGLKGHKVQFEAEFEHAKDDNTHSFYKRPSKALVLDLVAV